MIEFIFLVVFTSGCCFYGQFSWYENFVFNIGSAFMKPLFFVLSILREKGSFFPKFMEELFMGI